MDGLLQLFWTDWYMGLSSHHKQNVWHSQMKCIRRIAQICPDAEKEEIVETRYTNQVEDLWNSVNYNNHDGCLLSSIYITPGTSVESSKKGNEETDFPSELKIIPNVGTQ